jgi:hypothetical protein
MRISNLLILFTASRNSNPSLSASSYLAVWQCSHYRVNTARGGFAQNSAETQLRDAHSVRAEFTLHGNGAQAQPCNPNMRDLA